MGWNEGYRIMEQQVITLYDLNILNKETLNAIMQPFCDSDIDSGSSHNLKSKDGKSAEDIICYIMEPGKYTKATKDFVPDPEDPDWNEKLYNLYNEISRGTWRFW